MNKVELTGMIINDPEIKQAQSGTLTVRICLSVFRTKKDGQYINDLINCTAFGEKAEEISKGCAKGTRIGVEGNIKTGSYDGRDGKKVYTTEVWVEKFEYLERKSSQNTAPAPSAPPPQNQPAYAPTAYQGQQTPPPAPAYSQPDYPDFGYPGYPLPF